MLHYVLAKRVSTSVIIEYMENLQLLKLFRHVCVIIMRNLVSSLAFCSCRGLKEDKRQTDGRTMVLKKVLSHYGPQKGIESLWSLRGY